MLAGGLTQGFAVQGPESLQPEGRLGAVRAQATPGHDAMYLHDGSKHGQILLGVGLGLEHTEHLAP